MKNFYLQRYLSYVTFLLQTFLTLLVVAFLFFIYMVFFQGNGSIDLLSGDAVVQAEKLTVIEQLAFLAYAIAFVSLLFMSIYHLIQVFHSFKEDSFFDLSVIKSLNKSGNFFLLTAVFLFLSPNLENFIANVGEVEIGISSEVLLFLIIGMGLKIFAAVFERARQLQEENKLTI